MTVYLQAKTDTTFKKKFAVFSRTGHSTSYPSSLCSSPSSQSCSSVRIRGYATICFAAPPPGHSIARPHLHSPLFLRSVLSPGGARAFLPEPVPPVVIVVLLVFVFIAFPFLFLSLKEISSDGWAGPGGTGRGSSLASPRCSRGQVPEEGSR